LQIKERIVIVDSDLTVCEHISSVLRANGYETLKAHSFADGFSLITSQCPDLILLDCDLPDEDGIKLIRSTRTWSGVPFFVVTQRSRQRDIVDAFDAGADDYLIKPFGTPELIARVKNVLRHTKLSQRYGEENEGYKKIGDLFLDYEKHRVLISGNDIKLTQNEYKMVSLLSKHAGKLLSYDFIMRELWGPSPKGNNQVLRVNMTNIRKKISAYSDKEYIVTVPATGYYLKNE